MVEPRSPHGPARILPAVGGSSGKRRAISFFQVIFLLQLLLLSGVAAAEARSPAIAELVVINSQTHLLLYGKVVNGFTSEMETALQNGIPVVFTFSVELYRVKNPWPDQRLAVRTFDHTLSYDNLKEEYRIELQEKGGKIMATRSLAEAQGLMAEINGLPVGPLADLEPGGDYLLKVNTKLARKTLPLNIHALIPFWGVRDFKTDWHTVKFRY
jgi:hypothetical protein